MRYARTNGAVIWIISSFLSVGCADRSDAPPKAGERADRPAGQTATPVRYDEPRKLAHLANRTVDESSGLAASPSVEGVFWTHNDSGDAPRVYAFDREGQDLATLTLESAKAVDWEDMAAFRLDGKAWLLLADVGDNDARRPFVTLYLVPEPRLDPSAREQSLTARPEMSIHLTFPDGPRDCESVAVDTTTRTVYLVAKTDRAGVYAMPLPDAQPERKVTPERIGELGFSNATAMDISPDGLRAVVLTYLAAYEYVRGREEAWKSAFARRPRTLIVPLRRQGESVGYARDGRSLLLTSEKLPAPLFEVPAKPAD